MKKLAAVLTITTVMLSIACGFLLYQISDLQNRNSVFEDQLNTYQDQIDELENQIDGLENQTNELEIYYLNLTEQLEIQIVELENQTSDYKNQIGQLENQVNDLEEEIRLRIPVNITAFRAKGWNQVSKNVMSHCNVTVQNFGTNDVDGLTIRISGVNLIADDWIYGGVEQEVGLIKAGETKTINIESSQTIMMFSHITATLMLDDITIDKSTDYVGF